MIATVQILRYAAFTTDPDGGNPAGVVLDATAASDAEMQAVAAEVGFSETAFLSPTAVPGEFDVRYFSPLAEVPFCGHATIAAAVAAGDRLDATELLFRTAAGPVPVRTRLVDGVRTATLTSVAPQTADLSPALLADLLAALRWSADDLDPDLPPRLAFGGAWHPLLAVRERSRLAALDYDFDRLAALMAAQRWPATVALVHRRSATVFDARNPFPPGGVVEDPATGAAAAALGGYLRELGLVEPPATVTVHQGNDLGRPGVLVVDIPLTGGVDVTGSAVALP